MFLSRWQNAEQKQNIKTDEKSFENVEDQIVGTLATIRPRMQGTIKFNLEEIR